MSTWLKIIVGTLRSSVRSRRELALENVAVRQQLATLKHRCPKTFIDTNIHSAATEGSPPAPNKRANVTIKWIKRMARPRTIRTVSTTSPLVSFGFRGNLRYELRIRHTLVSLWTMLKWLGIITRTLWSALHNHRALAVDRLNWLIRCPKQ